MLTKGTSIEVTPKVRAKKMPSQMTQRYKIATPELGMESSH